MKNLPYESDQKVIDILASNKTINEKASAIYLNDYDNACMRTDRSSPKTSMSLRAIKEILIERER